MNSRSKIKVLPLENWMRRAESEFHKNSIPPSVKLIAPIFHREGWYLIRWHHQRYSWFEYNGKAWSYEAEMFKLPFEDTYSDSEIAALKVVLTTRMATPIQKKLLSDIEVSRLLRDGAYRMRNRTRRVLGQIKNRS